MKSRYVQSLLVICFLWFFLQSDSHSVFAQTDLPVGKIIKRVGAADNGLPSYALYLPSTYSPDREFPIVYAFDPGAHGAVAVQTFQKAAEKYGFIVAGSNSSRNGMNGDELTEAFFYLWEDTHRRFWINPKRTYAAGFSGGARVANRIALSCYTCSFAGVISVGAVFPSATSSVGKLPYLFFGAVGTEDFNYPEFVYAERRFIDDGTAFKIAAFAGGHQWLPEQIAEEALEWLEIRVPETVKNNPDFVSNIFDREMQKARLLVSQGKNYEAAKVYRNLIGDFSSLRDMTELNKTLFNLLKTKEFREGLAVDSKEIERQSAWVKKIFSLFLQTQNLETGIEASVNLKDEIEKLKRITENPLETSERRSAVRALNQIAAAGIEAARTIYLPKKDYQTAAANLRLALLVRPQESRLWFELARIYAIAESRGKARSALGNAVANGFRDCAELTRETAFQLLKNDAEFQKIIQNIECDLMQKDKL